MINIKKTLRSIGRSLVLCLCAVLIVHTNSVQAISPEQKRVMDSGSYFFNVDRSADCSPSTSAAGGVGGSIYVLGDSLTVGMTDLGSLDKKLNDAGWTPVKINAIGGKTLTWGKEQVQADRSIISTADSILIGLGTNNLHNVVSSGTTVIDGGQAAVETMIREIVAEVKAAHPGIKIYWTNTYGEGTLYDRDLPTAMRVINAAIDNVAISEGIGVLPWATSDIAAQYIKNNDVHPYSNYPEMADFIVGQLNAVSLGAGSASSSCCAVGGSGDSESNQAYVFNYLISKGFTPNQAAGVVGNMIVESGVNPIRMQRIYSLENSGGVDQVLLEPDGGVRLENFDAAANQLVQNGHFESISKIGWGLVQWTPASKMIDPSRAAGIPDAAIESIEYQSQFLWEQLTGTGVGGAAANEKSAGDKILLTTTVEEAAIAFGRYYERFTGSGDLGHDSYAERIDRAFKVLERLGSGTSSIATGSACGYSAGANGWDLPGEGTNPMAYFSQLREATAPEDPAVQGYYGEFPYGNGTISECGCGPVTWAMIVTTLTGNKVEPPEVADWAHENGYRNSTAVCAGSTWWWSSNAIVSEARWKVKASAISISEAPDLLRSGKLILASVGAGSPLLSSGGEGHILVMRAVTSDGKFLFADPSDSKSKRANGGDSGDSTIFSEYGSTSRTPLDAAQVQSGLKQLFVVEKL